MTNTVRKNIKIGAHVTVVEKHNQRSGKLTEGYVSRILTNSTHHRWGIKVMLTSGKVGRVTKILLPNSR